MAVGVTRLTTVCVERKDFSVVRFPLAPLFRVNNGAKGMQTVWIVPLVDSIGLTNDQRYSGWPQAEYTIHSDRPRQFYIYVIWIDVFVQVIIRLCSLSVSLIIYDTDSSPDDLEIWSSHHSEGLFFIHITALVFGVSFYSGKYVCSGRFRTYIQREKE